MKVTKTSDMSLLKTIEYLIAIQGCDICPCCGNSFRATKEIGVMCMNCNQQFVVVKMYK